MEKLNLQNNSYSKLCFRILFIFFWIRYTILNFVIEAIKRIPIIGVFDDFVIPICVVFLLLLSLPYFLQKIRPVDIFFYLIPLFVISITYILFPSNTEYLNENLWRIIGLVLPVYFLGISYEHEVLKKDLLFFSILGIITMTAYQIYSLSLGRVLLEDNMGAAYDLLPSILFLGLCAFERKKFLYYIGFFTSIILLFVFGTRGPVLAVVVFITFEVIARLIVTKASLKRYIFFFLFIVALFVLLSTNLMIRLMAYLKQVFEDIGFSTRIFEMFLEGEITEGSGRDILQEKVIHAIGEKPILGYGIFGDRVIIEGSYVHNIILELWCDFGIFIGSALMIALIVLIIKALKCSKDYTVFYFILMLISLVFTKLMLSGSYLTEQYLFFLIGISVECIRQKRT